MTSGYVIATFTSSFIRRGFPEIGKFIKPPTIGFHCLAIIFSLLMFRLDKIFKIAERIKKLNDK